MPTTVQQDTDDRFKWETIITTTDDFDLLLSRFTFFDDGTTRSEAFENGQLAALTLTDLGPAGAPSDVRPWERIEITYDGEGNVEDRYELRDDGVQILKSYEAGVLRLQQQVDFGPNGTTSDARSWERIETGFDDAGVISYKLQVNDNGVQQFTEYEDGVRRTFAQIDEGPQGEVSDVKPWQSIEIQYNALGEIELRYQVNDNGVQLITEYENGVRRAYTQIDEGPVGEVSDVKSWSHIETRYDVDGVIEAKFQVNDDGTTYLTEYENGIRSFQIREDKDEAGNSTDTFDWDFIAFNYDQNGAVTSKETLYDDGDVTALLYEDGVRAFKYELDGDNSQDWVSRETIYDAAGAVVEVNTYDFNIFDQDPGF